MTDQQVNETMPTNVVTALARVMAELGGIEKLTPQQRAKRGLGGGNDDGFGIKYAYRGIDQIAAAAQPLLGKYGVVIVPVGRTIEHLPFERGGKPGTWVHVRAHVDWLVCGPGGPADSFQASTFGEGDDNADKGANKAQTSAFKNLLLRLLCIGDPDDDADNVAPPAPEPAARKQAAPRQQAAARPADDVPPPPDNSAPAGNLATPAQVTKLQILLKEAGVTKRETALEVYPALVGVTVSTSKELTRKQAADLMDKLDDIIAGRASFTTDPDTLAITGMVTS